MCVCKCGHKAKFWLLRKQVLMSMLQTNYSLQGLQEWELINFSLVSVFVSLPVLARITLFVLVQLL